MPQPWDRIDDQLDEAYYAGGKTSRVVMVAAMCWIGCMFATAGALRCGSKVAQKAASLCKRSKNKA